VDRREVPRFSACTTIESRLEVEAQVLLCLVERRFSGMPALLGKTGDGRGVFK